jgi:hypothetical protein
MSDRMPPTPQRPETGASLEGELEERKGMAFSAGDHVLAESESTERPARRGVVEEVVRDDPRPRYRIRWDDGHESIYTPADGALRLAEPVNR